MPAAAAASVAASARLADRDRAAQRLDLAGVLVQPHVRDGGMRVDDRGVREGAAQRLGLEDPHPLALDADPRGAMRRGEGREGAVEAVGVLPVAGLRLGRGRLPARALEQRHHRVQRPLAGHDEQRRPLHQVKARAGQEVEVGAGHQRHGVEILPLHRGPEPRQPIHPHLPTPIARGSRYHLT